MSPLPFQLLELTIISAQDLSLVSKNLRTYAVSWINPEKKLRTRIDQKGLNNPIWNEKFVFRVDDEFLDSDDSAVMIEIFAVGWLRDIPVGSVEVLMGNLLPPSLRKDHRRRFVALQIRRPSGRPQGILNMGVTLLDNNMKSMPLYKEPSLLSMDHQDKIEGKNYTNNGEKMNQEEKRLHRRSRSDLTDVKQNVLKKNRINGGPASDEGGSMLEGGSIVVDGLSVTGSIVNASEVGPQKGGGNGSMCNSDVGPSASVVAAAVAHGLYPTPLSEPHKPGSSILGDWTAEDTSAEGLKTKIERWRTELPPSYNNKVNNYQKISKKKGRKNLKRDKNGNGSRFSCFGGAYGCEITIVCGGK